MIPGDEIVNELPVDKFLSTVKVIVSVMGTQGIRGAGSISTLPVTPKARYKAVGVDVLPISTVGALVGRDVGRDEGSGVGR